MKKEDLPGLLSNHECNFTNSNVAAAPFTEKQLLENVAAIIKEYKEGKLVQRPIDVYPMPMDEFIRMRAEFKP